MCLQAFALSDAWAHQFRERDPPTYTRTSVLCRVADGAQTMSRCIDRRSVSHGPLGYTSPMLTTPVGFSDHQSVVLQFIWMGVDGEQPSRWQFPLDALLDKENVDSISQELLSRVRGEYTEAFRCSQAVLRKAARRYNAQALIATPVYLQFWDILRRSVSHPMMAALFRYIAIQGPWISVLLQILRGRVLFLVLWGVVREESLSRASGVHHGDPLSPILFSLLTSIICFVLRPYGVCVWLY